MAGKQDVAGRGDRDELGQPFEDAQQDRPDDGLIAHSTSVAG
jgi:hypothetical protein